MFGRARRGGAGGGLRMRGPDHHFTLTVDFLDGVNGAKKRLELAAGRTLDVTVPAGVRDGQVLRLKGQGGEGIGGGPAGDALIEIKIAPHPLLPPRRRRHPHRAAGDARRGGAGRARRRADAHGRGDHDRAGQFQHRQRAAPAAARA